MKDIPKEMWRNKAYRSEQEKKQPYIRLRGSKIPYPNLHSSNFEMLVKTCTTEEIGQFMLALYKFIYQGDLSSANYSATSLPNATEPCVMCCLPVVGNVAVSIDVKGPNAYLLSAKFYPCQGNV